MRYEQSGTHTTVADYLELDKGQIEPGRYTVRMTVKDLNSDQTTGQIVAFSVLSAPGPSHPTALRIAIICPMASAQPTPARLYLR